jgi:hypothetical protein
MASTFPPSLNHPIDLHPLVDTVAASIEFRYIREGRFVRVHLLKETLAECYGVEDSPYGILKAYDEHRPEIDAAVVRRARASENDAVLLTCDDLLTH